MYRQVNINPEQRNLQRIIWRENPNQELSHFALNTVTYGIASSSFLAIRSLHQTAIDAEKEFPYASKVMLSDFYVDEFITGHDSLQELKTLKKDVYNILKSAGFILTQWMSNNRDLIDYAENAQENFDLRASEEQSVKTLGVIWNPNADSFQFTVQPIPEIKTLTKRTCLSIISTIFDPLALVGPVLTQAKIILQELWKQRLDWDDPILEPYNSQFLQFFEDLRALSQISIPRHALFSTYISLQIHGFSDASLRAFGAVVYLRCTDSNGKHYSNILCSKLRIGPTKVISLPRLELQGAVLITKLVSNVQIALKINIENSNIFYWTDSTIVLSWISREPSAYKIFVSNRISKIQDRTELSQWHHVNSKENPADVISRGCKPSVLINCDLWWNGPSFLLKNESEWPKLKTTELNSSEDMERKNAKFTLVATKEEKFELIYKYSTLFKLFRVMAYCLRFIKHCRSKNNYVKPDSKSLSVDEICQAEIKIIQIVQRETFSRDIKDLRERKILSNKSKIKNLNPFLWKDQILRVGGRIQHAKQIPFNHKFPILLPNNHFFTTLVIRYEHAKTLHGGIQTVLSSVRTKYWPIHGRGSVRKVVRECIPCFRVKPVNSAPPIMGQLPPARVTPSRPWTSCGIDFAGPFLVKDGTLRSRKVVKTYIVIFICLSTKAINLELAGDLSTNCFLNAFKRFVSRRSLPKEVHTDNGSNFKGANAYLDKLELNLREFYDDPLIKFYLLENKVTWYFIAARSPTFGGLWESAVKIMKFHLVRIMGSLHLTYESFYTVLTQVESILNSRPLTPLSEDPNDPEVLTPGHFLIGSKLNALPEENIEDIAINCLSRYQQVQQITQHFWKRFSHEYLHNLQVRNKWMTENDNLKPGLMVVMHEDNVLPLQWKIARISEVHPGTDGVVRVVSLKIPNGTFKRAVTKISVLPIEQ